MTTPLRLRFRTLRETQGRDQYQIADAVGVAQPSISGWETGHRTPRAHHAIAWAASLQHRLIVTRNNRYIGDLQHVLANLPQLRRSLGYRGIDVANRLHVAQVTKTETRALRGLPLELITVNRYLNAIDCHINLQPAEVPPC